MMARTIALGLLLLITRVAPAAVSEPPVAPKVLSLVYPAVALLGGAYLFKAKARERKNTPYWFAAVFVVVHLLIAGYMTMHGAIGVRTWA